MKINLSNIKGMSTKREKISKSQQSTLLIVGLSSVVVGASIVMIVNLNKYISFNNTVISEKDEAKKNYSSVIEKSGACLATKSNDNIYTNKELENCSPNDIDYKDVPDSLRFNILSDAASDIGLESIARTGVGICINPDTDVQYTHDELEELYEGAKTSNERRTYLNAIRNCSALRVVSDALPLGANPEALLASLNKIYILSDWSPDSLSPNASNDNGSTFDGYSSIPVSLRMEDAHTSQVMAFLGNLNKSIRYFSITSLEIDTKTGVGNIDITAGAEAFYSNAVTNSETLKTLTLRSNK